MNHEQMVTTALGLCPQRLLRWELTESDEGNTVIVAREYFYTGTDPATLSAVAALETPNHHIRRDVWVTVKCGQAASGIQG